jgi:predicted nucleic acid-binding protein
LTLLDAIAEKELVALDTVIWIYVVEANPVFGPAANLFFSERLARGLNQAGSSLLALGELLVQPLSLGNLNVADKYRLYFSPRENWQVWEVTRNVVERAASLRAKYRLKLIDALHLATAIENQAQYFLTNDEGFRKVTEIKILILGDFVIPGSPSP